MAASMFTKKLLSIVRQPYISFFQTKELCFQKTPDVTLRILVANVHANLSPPFYDINNPKAAIMAIVLQY